MAQFEKAGHTGKPDNPKAAKAAPVGDGIRVESEDGWYGFINYLYHPDPNTDARVIDATATLDVEIVEREASASSGSAEVVDGSGGVNIPDTDTALRIVIDHAPGYGEKSARDLLKNDPVALLNLAKAFAHKA